MKILAVADEPAPGLYEYYKPGRLKEYDLIISCGDLKREYLEFLVTMARCPLYYVHGNHDESLLKDPPQGCVCIDGKLVVYKGVRIMGLGGSNRYRTGECMYTEGEMRCRILGLLPSVFAHKGFDVLVTHAPARGVQDLDTVPHRGYECFCGLLRRFSPRFMLHGHVHMQYDHRIRREISFENTRVINAFSFTEIEL